ISGGSRVNVVAEYASAEVDARAPTKDAADRLVAAMKALTPKTPGTTVTVVGGFGRPPLERSAHVVELYALARSVAAEMGHELAEGGTGGGSDGNFTAALGVPTLDGLGAVGDGAHAIDEHVDVDALAWRAALVAGLIVRLGAR
ncbi:MAG: M20/M25/M40 family metallo-hydrolase, partial [Acidobacteria bacterium]|nr:M20/M25/M40 family metallo-hydrolase [Acidobacteriota bacterium]